MTPAAALLSLGVPDVMLYMHMRKFRMQNRSLLHCYLFGIPYSMVYMRARALYPRTSPARRRLPASQFRGESGAASLISARMACSKHASQRSSAYRPCASDSQH